MAEKDVKDIIVSQKVKTLDLSNQHLTYLPNGIEQLTHLTSLDLSNNSLRELPAEIGQLPNLTSLNLSDNVLTSLPKELWNLTNLLVLNVSNNNLEFLHPGLAQLENLQELYLGSYEEKLLAKRGKVRFLKETNKFKNLPDEIFSLHNLEILGAGNISLNTIPHSITNLKNLVGLDLSRNELDSLPSFFVQLNSIEYLNLSGNNFASLPAEIGELKNLTFFDLSANPLGVLPTYISELKKLKSLDLSRTQFKDFPENLWKLVNLKRLGFSYNELKSLPKEISQLINLVELNLSGNYLTTLPSEFEQLVNLISLNLSDNQLAILPSGIENLSNLRSLDITENKISHLPFKIGRLKKLQSLYVDQNKLSAIPKSIGNLTDLTELILGKNRIKSLPSEIGHLLNLRILYFTDNQVTNLPPEIGLLTKLEVLAFMNNKVTKLPSQIGNLRNLKMLDVTANPIPNLPPEINNIKKLEDIFLEGTQLPIPPEILANTKNPQSILDYYFSSLKKRLNEIKLLIVGQGGVGKTSIVRRLAIGGFNSSETKTEGISIHSWQVNDQLKNETSLSKIKANIWDFGGQEIMHATHQFFLTKRSLYLLVLDSRLTQEENRVEYWLKIIQSFGGESPVLIVGNKIDQHPLDIDRTGLQKKYPNIVGILETSAATGAGIEELKAAITEQVNNLPHVRDLLPETWFTVKTKLEGLGRESNFITHDKYLELCAENEVSDETSQRTLIGFLHDLGVVLHFQDDPRLEALGILNPQWVTNGVYKILNSHTLFQNKGVLTTSMLDEILNLPEYPRGKRLFIVDMMKKFELCYDIESDKTFLVPDLLPKDEPAELKFNGIPAFEYAYPVLPSSVITRFIVRMNQHIHDNCVWRTGVVLKIGENKALVKADIEDRKITIAIDGIEHTRRDALSAIRYQLDEIHGSIKGLDAQKRVPIPEAPNAEPLDYDYLLQLEQDGFEEHPVKNRNRLVKVNVKKLLSGVVSETERRQSAGNTTNIYIGGDVKGGTIIAGDENEVKKL